MYPRAAAESLRSLLSLVVRPQEGISVNIASLVEYRKRLCDKKATYFVDWPVTPEQREACWENLKQTLDALLMPSLPSARAAASKTPLTSSAGPLSTTTN